MTFSRLLSQYAYQTVACGKLHHTGVDQMQGWTHRIGSDTRTGAVGVQAEEFASYTRPFSDMKWSEAKEVKRAGIGNAHAQTADEYTVQGALNFIDDYFGSAFYDREQGAAPPAQGELDPAALPVSNR